MNTPTASDMARVLARARQWMRHFSWCDSVNVYRHGDSCEGVCDCGAGDDIDAVQDALKEFGLAGWDPGEARRTVEIRKSAAARIRELEAELATLREKKS